jgi:hypothetical protein
MHLIYNDGFGPIVEEWEEWRRGCVGEQFSSVC